MLRTLIALAFIAMAASTVVAQTLEELTAERDRLQQRVVDLGQRLQTIDTETADVEARIAELQARLRELSAQRTDLTDERQRLLDDVAQLNDRILQLQRERERQVGANPRKLNIAVAPMRLPHERFEFEGNRVPAQDVERRLNQEIVSQLVDSRRFAVLDRTYTAEVTRELARLRDGQVADEELARLGKQLGADFLVVGTLEDAVIDRTDGVVRLTGLPYSTYRGRVSAAFRVVDVATTQTILADTVTLAFDDEQLRRLAQLRGDTRLDDVMLWAAGDRLATILIDAIDPMRVVQVEADGTVVLNQGGDRLEIGDRLTVFRSGQQLTDPVTGEPLANAEQAVATVEVARKTPAVGYARVIEGEPRAVQRGDIVRR